ncbi:MAG: hypothetical protein RL632_2127 [Bacteroidota bacterium]|jgi:hypothetical protein
MLALCIGFQCQASLSRIKKGFEALEIYDYFNAKSNFEKSLKHYESPASFGLATIYLRRDNPFHSLDSAYFYIQRAQESFGELKEKQLLKLNVFGFSEKAMDELRQKISTEFFKVAESQHTALAYQGFMDNHATASEMELARYRRDSLAYEDAKAIGSSAAFEGYRDNYTGSVFSEQALEEYYLAKYQEVTADHSLASYQMFLLCCPENPYAPIAQDSVYSLSTRSKTLNDFVYFVENNAGNQNLTDAWKKIYQLYMIDFTEQRLAQFKVDFPDYPFLNTLELEQELLNTSLFPFNCSGNYGFMDRMGVEKIAPQFDQLGFFYEGLATAVKEERYGYVDKLGSVVIPFRFESASDFEGGRAIVQENGLYGVIDRIGNFILKPIYSDIQGLSSGLFLVAKDSMYGYVDKEGVLKIPFQYTDAYPFSKGMAKVEVDGKQAYINEQGDFVVMPCKTSIKFFNDSLLVFEEGELFGLMRKNCSVVIPATYDVIGELSSNRALVTLDDKLGYVDGIGKVVIELKYQYFPNCTKIGAYKSGYAVVMKEGKFGAINEQGKTILGFNQTQIGSIKALTAFSKGTLWGYKDLTGKVLIEPAYDYAESFQGGIAIVEIAGKQGVIDAKGVFLMPVKYNEVSRLTNDLLLVSDGDLFGIFSNKGKEIVPIRYRRITQRVDEFFILMNDNDVHYFLISENRILTPAHGNE